MNWLDCRRLVCKLFLLFAFVLSGLFSLSTPLWAQSSSHVVQTEGYISVNAVRPGDAFKVAVVLQIAKGYHINAHVPTLEYLIPTVVSFQAPPGISIRAPEYPHPLRRTFSFSPQTPLSVHEGRVLIMANVKAGSSLATGEFLVRASVQVQACNDAQCLAPANLKLEIPFQTVAQGAPVREVNPSVFAEEPGSTFRQTEPARPSSSNLVQFGNTTPRNAISDLIESRGLLVALLFVFLSGLALNTTPCVYPIIPITIGFFAGQSEGRLRRTFLMSAAYVVGMAITYSVLGVVASLSQGLFGAALQKPIVLIGLAGLMVGLSLSMFGLYEFRLPIFLNRFAAHTTQSRGGLTGAFLMGLMMGIVAAPCIGPFVLGLLIHVGTKGDPVYGFFLFFVLALGLGLPYLVLGTFSGVLKSLPRSGEWMVSVRKVFGLVLLGMAIYFLMPLLGRFSTSVLVGFLALSAVYLFFWESRRVRPARFSWVLRTVGLGAALASVTMALPERETQGIAWESYSPEALRTAQQRNLPVIIDAFAEWCIPCKELDKITFADAAVRQRASQFLCLKLDLTHDDDGSMAAKAREQFGIRGVPTILFFDAMGRDRTDLRLEGFEQPTAFLNRMNQTLGQEAGHPGSPGTSFLHSP
jgi:thioredoxin:protein disulfide reductase